MLTADKRLTSWNKERARCLDRTQTSEMKKSVLNSTLTPCKAVRCKVRVK